MTSRIQKLIKDRNDQINYSDILKRHPWIVQKGRSCILSPDSDGLLCGLFMSHFLSWKIVGFYDGKVCIVEKTSIDQKPIFLDMEIFRKEIRSVGHHMVQYNKRHVPTNWTNFDNCIQPNILRNYDGKNDFRLKYPLGTIHLLIGIVASQVGSFKLPSSAIPPLFFTDGVFNILFKYPENVLNWLNFLRIGEDWHPLKTVFENDKYTVFTLMKAMDDFFRKRDEISIPKERGDRLRISNTDGGPANLKDVGNRTFHVTVEAKERAIRFIEILSNSTHWKFVQSGWNCWDNMQLLRFEKKDFTSAKKSLNNKTFSDLMDQNPLSWAMTSGQNIEYTLEKPDKIIK